MAESNEDSSSQVSPLIHNYLNFVIVVRIQFVSSLSKR